MPTIDNREPIDAASAEYEPLLRRLQGNILKGHGRCFTANIFLQFHVQGPELKAVLRSLTARFVTSAYAQLRQRNQYQMLLAQPAHLRPADPMFGNLFLTRNTYKKLGLEAQLTEWFSDPDEGVQTKPQRSRFRTGMLEAAGELGDELTASDAVDPLEIAYLEGTIDALMLLANNSESHVIETAERLMEDLSGPGIATTVAFETGSVRRNHLCQGIEHFGYADGISQPLFFTSDFERLAGVEPHDRWDPFAPLSLALLRDRGTEDENAFGSYFVFRKLEQNVRAFHDAETSLAAELGLNGEDADRAGAMIIGRFRDGTPLALSGVSGAMPAGSNNFRYDGLLHTLEPQAGSGDRLGLKCPFQSHIRKVNPRQSQNTTTATRPVIEENERNDRAHRIVRRGITYGVRAAGDLPESGVGLLFGCFQRSIIEQYAFIQRNWANTSIFKVPGATAADSTGLDPVIGQPLSRSKPAQHWRAVYGGIFEPEPENLADLALSRSHATALEVGNLVRFRGGEFFFAPSLPFLLGQ